MEHVHLKPKQASAVLGVPQKDLQNFVQARVLKPRRRLGIYYFDSHMLLQARVVVYLKASLGASTRYLTKFAAAVAGLPGFETRTPAVVSLRVSAWKTEPSVEIRIPLGVLAEQLRQRLPLAAAAKDLPRGRKRPGWKAEFTTAVRAAASDLNGMSEKQIADAIRAYCRERGKWGLTVVAESVKGVGVDVSSTGSVANALRILKRAGAGRSPVAGDELPTVDSGRRNS